ncbi:hypothetical protein F2Q69_00029636 [Brassica cretica]|uniref:Uncharacterized protein n=1 Tax=Brassica cretica TaxID=69181 RepID=A0A8S9RYJ9_BRACR|nr:hypothetical protein F2Q69_00029636 [Brassica cretica]
MGKGLWSRRQHMTEARSSTEASQRVVRQVCQVMMQYLLFRCSRGCIMIKHEETDGWRMHNSWGRKVWCGAHLVGEKSTLGVKVSRHRDTKAGLIEREKLLEVFWGRVEVVVEEDKTHPLPFIRRRRRLSFFRLSETVRFKAFVLNSIDSVAHDEFCEMVCVRSKKAPYNDFEGPGSTKIWFPKVSGVVPVILMLPYLSKFITQKIALQSNVVDIEKVYRNDTFFESAIPRSPYHKEKGLWALLADSNNVWLFKKVSFMDGAEAILFFN